MEPENYFLVVKGKEPIERYGLQEAKLGDKYILEVTKCENEKVGLNFVKQ